MSDSPLVLVISGENDPQLHMFKAIPHVVVSDAESLARAPKDAAAILHWTGKRDLLRAAFLANPQVRWVHSRNAGLDSMLFPELVESPVPLTNGSGVFSQSLGEFALAMVLYFAKDFPRMLRNKGAHRWETFDVDEIAGQTAGIVGYGDIGRAVARRLHAMGMKVLALKRHAPAGGDPLVAAVLHAEGAARHACPLRLRGGRGAAHRGDAAHDFRCRVCGHEIRARWSSTWAAGRSSIRPR